MWSYITVLTETAEKGSDKLSHVHMPHKLHALNINNIVGIQSFLTNCHQYVLANNCTLSLVLVLSEEPQGSVLGPLLFLIYVANFTDLLLCSIRLYPDSCVLYLEVKEPSDSMHLQSDLHKLLTWCSALELELTKCKHLRVSRSNNKGPT